MAKKLKDYYDVEYLKHLSNLLTKESPSFDQDLFLDLTKSIHELEFSQRQERIATALYEAFDLSYEETLSVFYKILGPILKGNSGAFTEGWWLWPIGRYVEIYGDSHFEVSVNFSKALTKRFTSEYCMRVLIKNTRKNL